MAGGWQEYLPHPTPSFTRFFYHPTLSYLILPPYNHILPRPTLDPPAILPCPTQSYPILPSPESLPPGTRSLSPDSLTGPGPMVPTASRDQVPWSQHPDFNLPSQRPKRKNKRLPRRELPTAFSVRRATLPVHGNLSVRAQFHNRPVDLPPLPTNQSNVTMDKASAMHLRELLDDTNECFQLMLMTTIRFDKCIG